MENKTTKKKTTKKKAVKKIDSDVVKDNIDKIERTLYSIEGKFLHIKVGDERNPADDPAVQDVQEQIDNLLEKNKVKAMAYVTHHAVEITVYGLEN